MRKMGREAAEEMLEGQHQVRAAKESEKREWIVRRVRNRGLELVMKLQ